MMDALLLPLLVFVALFIFAGFLKKSQSSSQSDDTPELGYRKKGPLFTPAESSFFGVLLQAGDQEKYQTSYKRFGQGPVVDLLKPQSSHKSLQHHTSFSLYDVIEKAVVILLRPV